MSLSRFYISAFTVLVAQSLTAATAFATPALSFNESTGESPVHGNHTLGASVTSSVVPEPATVGIFWLGTAMAIAAMRKSRREQRLT